jgi:hypothetical protein
VGAAVAGGAGGAAAIGDETAVFGEFVATGTGALSDRVPVQATPRRRLPPMMAKMLIRLTASPSSTAGRRPRHSKVTLGSSLDYITAAYVPLGMDLVVTSRYT